MKRLQTGILVMGTVFLFFLVMSLFLDDTVIQFQNNTNKSLLLFFIVMVLGGIIVDYLRSKIKK